MVSPKVVITPDQPTLEQVGLGEFPDTIKFDGKAMHIPKLDAQDLNNMLQIDGELGGLYRILTTPLRGSEIIVKEANSRSKTEANFVREILISPYKEGGMTTPLETVLATVLRMLIDGWAPHEIVWEIRKGYVRVRKIDYRPVTTISPILDKYNDVEKYEQDLSKIDIRRIAGDDNKVIIKSDKVLHFVNSPEWNPIFGRSSFVQAYYHAEKKHKLYRIAHIAAQINALRLRRIRIPVDKENDSQKYIDLVSKLGFNSTIALPEDIDLELLDVGNNFPDIMPLIQHHDTQASKSVLAQVIDVGVEGRTGSFNLSESHLDIFLVNLELMGQYVAKIINSVIIPKIIDWNFGTGNYPKIQFQPFDRLIKKQLFDVYTRIAGSANINVSPEFLLEIEKEVARTIGLRVEYDKIEEKVTEMFRQKILNPKGSDSSEGSGDPDTRDRSTRTD